MRGFDWVTAGNLSQELSCFFISIKLKLLRGFDSDLQSQDKPLSSQVSWVCFETFFKKSNGFIKKMSSSSSQAVTSLLFFSLLMDKLPHSWLHLIFCFNCLPFLSLILLPENLRSNRNWEKISIFFYLFFKVLTFPLKT